MVRNIIILLISIIIALQGVVIPINAADLQLSALDSFTTSSVREKSPSLYEISFDGTKSIITIGDNNKTADFKPDLTISHWDGRESFSLIAVTNTEVNSQLVSSIDDDIITASNGDWNFEYKAVSPSTGFNEYGGIDITITAYTKPLTNKILFSYDSNTVTPYVQPPLTDEYQDGWSDEYQTNIVVTETEVKDAKTGEVLNYRPDYIVGSIAFYANDKFDYKLGGINYKTGKIGNLYPMQVNGEWCRWTIQGDFIVLNIPDTAFNGKYPIIITPVGDTFGYTSIGGSTTGFSANYWRAMGGVPTGDGVANSVHVYGEATGESYCKAVITDSSGIILANGVGDATLLDTDPAWNTLTFSTDPDIDNNTYYGGAINDDGNLTFNYDSGSSAITRRDSSNSYASPTNPSDMTTSSAYYSIYTTYTLSGGGDPPTVSTDAASSVEDTTATLNGEVTDDGGETIDYYGFVWDDDSDEGDPGDVDPSTPPGTWENGWKSNVGDYGENTFSHAITGLPEGTTIHFRAAAHNVNGWTYGSAQTFLTKPAAPTNVSATDGAHTDKVVITWTKSTSATAYKIYRDGGLIDTVGDVATYDDTTAAAPTITAGSASATDGTFTDKTNLSLIGTSANNGTTYTYKLKATNATGDSDDSATDTGYRGVGALTYQWQRSFIDADADYYNIPGATGATYSDTDGAVDPDGRWYQCVLTATGAAGQTSASNRGYRASSGGGTADPLLIPLLIPASLPLVQKIRRKIRARRLGK